jgi:hypothetical protein
MRVADIPPDNAYAKPTILGNFVLKVWFLMVVFIDSLKNIIRIEQMRNIINY